MRQTLWKLHQWLGIFTCFAVLLWGISGALHPLMSWLQPVPAQFSAPAQVFDLSHALPLKAVLEKHGIDEFNQVSVVKLAEQDCYRVQSSDVPQARYFSVNSGDEVVEADRLYAEQLARHFSGLPQQAIVRSTLVTAFDNDYVFINRILPVWRVDFAEPAKLSAYIDTDQSRLATLSNPLRDGFSAWFRITHTWSFLDDQPWLQLVIVLFLLGCVLFSALSGIYFYIVLRPSVKQRLQGQPLQRSHRLLGSVFAITALMSASSGMYHLIHGFDPNQGAMTNNDDELSSQYRALHAFERSEITDAAWQSLVQTSFARFNAIRFNGQLVWLRSPAGSNEAKAQVAMLAQEKKQHEAHHPSAGSQQMAHDANQLIVPDGTLLPDGTSQWAQNLAAMFAKRPLTDLVRTDYLTAFTPEYGFINKRLPVYRVEFSGPEQPRYFVESATSQLAAHVVQADVYEGWSFAWLHKWRFAFLSKTVQDSLLVLVGLANVVVACLGLTLFVRKRTRH
ncbi:MAG TPA: PepSY domain-containing protein [Pseudomonadales bacterium]|nr:PepSY domain-containing protein [Pseudomonadales bacterium]